MIATALARALLRLLAVPACPVPRGFPLVIFAAAPRAAFARYAIGVGVAASAMSALAGEVKPTIAIASPGTACVAPPAEMRRKHMDLLKHQRDRTLRHGERGAKVSLNACVDCHASRKTGSVIAGKDDFCRSCHAYAAVNLDCFECHRGSARAALAATTEARR